MLMIAQQGGVLPVQAAAIFLFSELSRSFSCYIYFILTDLLNL